MVRIAPVRHEGFCGSNSSVPVTKYGLEIIEVLEVVRTAALGEVAIYQHWIEDPDGAEVDLEWVPKREVIEFRSVDSLVAAFRTMGMTPSSAAKRKAAPALVMPASETLQ